MTTSNGIADHVALAQVAGALDRHLIVSFPEEVPAPLADGVQLA